MRDPFDVAPAPGSAEEAAAFARLQAGFQEQFERVFPDPLAPRTVVVVPSLSLPPDELAKIGGVHHYEERMLPGFNRSSQHPCGGTSDEHTEAEFGKDRATTPAFAWETLGRTSGAPPAVLV